MVQRSQLQLSVLSLLDLFTCFPPRLELCQVTSVSAEQQLKLDVICQTLPITEAPRAPCFLPSPPLSPSGNFSFVFRRRWQCENSDPRRRPPHTQPERRAALLPEVHHWINPPLLFLNQYCETYERGCRGGKEGRQPADKSPVPRWKSLRAAFPWTYTVWFRVKREALVWK